MPNPTTLPKALDAYAAAVASRAYWQSNGRHGDGRLEAAKAAEAAARRTVIRIARQAAR